MKRKMLKIVMLLVVAISLYNIFICSSMGKKSVSIILNDIEAVAADVSGINHGRLLLQSTSGYFKCANCTGTDCDAVC